MSPRLPRFVRLTIGDWLGLIQAYWYLSLAGWKVYVLRENLGPWLQGARLARHNQLDARTKQKCSKMAAYIDIASRHPFPWARCLQRSFALCIWLRAWGLDPVLRIGVRSSGSRLEAHAWVQQHGLTFGNGPEAENPFIRLVESEKVRPSTTRLRGRSN